MNRLILLLLLVIAGVVGGCDSKHAASETVLRPGQPDYIRASQSDPELDKAIEAARTNLPAFIAALKSPGASRSGFTIKRPFIEGESTEHIWLVNAIFDGAVFHGEVNNEPVDVRNVKLGDKVTASKDQVSDWFYVENGKLVGGYTIRYFFEKMSPAEQRQYRAGLPYRLD